MGDRQFLVAREVAATHRRMAPPSLARIPDTCSLGRRPRLGRSHPRATGITGHPSGREGVGTLAKMVDRQLLVARAVAETLRRRSRLGRSHPRSDGNYRSTI